jgi:hypothetical protein
MSDHDNHHERTINDLVAKIEEKLKPINAEKRIVNDLCAMYGMPPRFADVDSGAFGGSLTIKRDQFHAKPLATAVREYLKQRGPSDRGGLGAASVNEIFDALIAGGYKPETDDEDNAKRGLRIALTKNSVTFYRVPGGAYGLLEWYPNAKPQIDETEDSPPKKRRGRPPATSKQRPKRGRPKKPSASAEQPKAASGGGEPKPVPSTEAKDEEGKAALRMLPMPAPPKDQKAA